MSSLAIGVVGTLMTTGSVMAAGPPSVTPVIWGASAPSAIPGSYIVKPADPFPVLRVVHCADVACADQLVAPF